MDGSVVAALVAACGTGAGGVGAITAAVLSRRSAREAKDQATEAGKNAAAAAASQLGYDTLVFSVTTLQSGYKRLEAELATERTERKADAAGFRAEITACHHSRDELALQVQRLTNGA